MTKEIEEKVREQARQWFISSDMNVKDFALSVAKYVYEITTATQPADVQERAKVNTNRGHSTNDNVRESKVPESDAAHLAGASSVSGMQEGEIKVTKYFLERIENTLRLCANTLESHSKTTCLDRDIMQHYEWVKSILAGNSVDEIPKR